MRINKATPARKSGSIKAQTVKAAPDFSHIDAMISLIEKDLTTVASKHLIISQNDLQSYRQCCREIRQQLLKAETIITSSGPEVQKLISSKLKLAAVERQLGALSAKQQNCRPKKAFDKSVFISSATAPTQKTLDRYNLGAFSSDDKIIRQAKRDGMISNSD
jgi:hypothetical protein